MSFPPPPPSPEELPEDLPKTDNLMKAVLVPLLEDFQYWFGRTIEMLEAENIGFLTVDQQQALLERVKSAQQQVSASQMLSSATDSQAGIEMPVVMSWHSLVHECWGIAIRLRQADQPEAAQPKPIQDDEPSQEPEID